MLTYSHAAIYANQVIIDRTGNDGTRIPMFFDDLLKALFGKSYKSLLKLG